MKNSTFDLIKDLVKRYPDLGCIKNDLTDAVEMLINCYANGGKVLVCGNGGSASDALHIVGELMKDFLIKRPLDESQRARMKKKLPKIEDAVLDNLQCGLPAISLPSITGFNTAFCNDRNAELVYAQGVLALAGSNDVLVAISTSGNAKNVLRAAEVAKGLGLSVIGLSGRTGGSLKELSDACICVPEDETYKIQELHIAVYHYQQSNDQQ